MLTVWGRATSSNVQKVMWTVGELGLAHERVDAGGPFGGLDAPDYRAMNPHGLVPTVRTEDGLVLWESNAIVRHLARRDPERRLWPPDPEREARADMWAEWSHNTVARPIIDLFWAFVRTHPSRHDERLIANLRGRAVTALTAADGWLTARPWIAGDAFTIADIVFGHLLYRWHEMDIERPALDALAGYYERLRARPSYATHVMVDFSSLYATA